MSKPDLRGNEAILNNLSGELYTIALDDKISDNHQYPVGLDWATHNQK